MKKIIYILTILFSSYITYSQSKLTTEDAINIALKNNFDIQIAKNNVEISRINNYIGFAGGLPTIGISGTDIESLNTINQKLSTGSNTNRNGAYSNALSTGITGSILLYNGYYVQATKHRLAELQTQSEEQLNAQIQNTIANVMLKYYDIVRQESYLKTILQSIEVSKKRKEIIESKKTIGLANAADSYQSEIDLNVSQQNLQAQQLIIQQDKIDLLNLLKQKLDYSFYIIDTIIIDKTIQLDSILVNLKNNPNILIANQQILINQWAEKEITSQMYPAIRLNTGYNYTRNQSAAGLTLLNQTYGPFIGLNIQIPIFNGNILKREQQTAKITIQNAQLQTESLWKDLQATTIKTWETYQTTLQQLQTEQNNYILTQKLLQLTLQKLQLGQATIIDTREAQKSFEDAGYRLVNLTYAAKVAEINLKQLANQLAY